MEKRDLVGILNEVLFPSGFKKKGDYWKMEGLSITKVVYLQQSKFANSFYINYGYIINSIPLENLTMHVFNGFGSLNENVNNLIKNLLDFENAISFENRKDGLRKVIVDDLLYHIMQINTEDDLLLYLKSKSHLNDIPLAVKKHFKLTLH